MPRIWMIRHGQSEANAGMRSANAAGIPLTPLGQAQAEAVARRFGPPPAQIAFSPYRRAEQTAAPTRVRFPAAQAAPWPVHEFTYLSPERCKDTTSAERVPLVEAYWSQADPDLRDGPGVESFRAFLARVDAALERLSAIAAPTVAVFTHGQFMQAAMWRLGPGAGPDAASRMARFRAFMLALAVPNAGVVELGLGSGQPRVGAVESAHLGALPLTY